LPERRKNGCATWLARGVQFDTRSPFVKILRGDMNPVSSRPHPVSSFALSAEQIPYHGLWASVRLGVIGAQICYGDANSFEGEIETMRDDIFGRGSPAPDADRPQVPAAQDVRPISIASRQAGGSLPNPIAAGETRETHGGTRSAP
jgi:hypothetical protein